MQKTTKKESLIFQLKAIPNQVKVFILGLFVVVLAVASILPNLNSKSLQGNVLNVKTESKVDGYGYSYQPLQNCFLVESNNEVKISCSKQESNICQTPENVLACSLMLSDCPSQCRPAQCQTPENVLACSLGLDSCPQECRYGWNQTGTNETGSNQCQNPENILACSLMLNDCPMQCRPAQCQLPPEVLACSLESESCLTECRYGWNNNGTGNGADMTLANISHTTDGKHITFKWNSLAGSDIIDISIMVPGNSVFTKVATVNMSDQEYSFVLSYGKNIFKFIPNNGGKEAIYEIENYNTTSSYRTDRLNRDGPGGKGDYETYSDFNPVPCREGFQVTDVDFVRVDTQQVVEQVAHSSLKGGYCLNSENPKGCVDYKIKFKCEEITKNTIEEVKSPAEVVETPIVEEIKTTTEVVETPVVEEQISKERADSLLETVRNIFK